MAQGMSYDWIELAALLADGKMVRGHYVRGEDLDAISAWRKRFNNTDLFSSVAFYAEPNNSATSIFPWYFDIDCPHDLPATRESMLMLCEMLMDRTRVPQDSLNLFFSGNKGFHVVIAPHVFQAFYSPYTLGLYRRMAQRARDAGVRFIDGSVYSRKRLWRLVNSRHGRSGLFKIQLQYEELRDISIDGIRTLAANPRPDDTLATQHVCEEAAEWYRRAIVVFAGLSNYLKRVVLADNHP
jgi:DNA primase catalytic subunit